MPIQGFEVRFKRNRHIFSRHTEATCPEAAVDRLKNTTNGRVIGVRKVRPSDIIGDVDQIARKLGIRNNSIFARVKEEKHDVITDNVTLDEIVFGKKVARAKRIEMNQKHNKKEEV